MKSDLFIAVIPKNVRAKISDQIRQVIYRYDTFIHVISDIHGIITCQFLLAQSIICIFLCTQISSLGRHKDITVSNFMRQNFVNENLTNQVGEVLPPYITTQRTPLVTFFFHAR